MSVERVLRGMGGFFTLLSLGLGYFVHPGWYLFTAFVGLNLFQSAFTNTCPAKLVLQKLGLPSCEVASQRDAAVGAAAPRR